MSKESRTAVSDRAAKEMNPATSATSRIRTAWAKSQRFRTFGCGTAIAASSAAAELLRGRAVNESLKPTNERVSAALGGLPAAKSRCPVLAGDAVKAAVEDYLRRRKA